MLEILDKSRKLPPVASTRKLKADAAYDASRLTHRQDLTPQPPENHREGGDSK